MNKLDNCLIHLLHRASQCADEVFLAEQEQFQLTPRQYIILAATSLNEGLSQTELVRHTGIDRSTVAGVIRRLMASGLLQRRRTDHDARAYSVKLTEQGREVLMSAEKVSQRVNQRLNEQLPLQNRDEFLQTLERLAKLDEENVTETIT